MPDGRYYWGNRVVNVVDTFLMDGTIPEAVPPDEIYMVPEVVEQVMITYEPETYEKTFAKIKAQYKNDPEKYKELFGLELKE